MSKPVSRLLHCMCRWAVQVYMSLLYYHLYQRILICSFVVLFISLWLSLSLSFSPLSLSLVSLSLSQNAWFDNHYYWSTVGTWDANSYLSLSLFWSFSLSLSKCLFWQSLVVLLIYWLPGTWVRNFEQLTTIVDANWKKTPKLHVYTLLYSIGGNEKPQLFRRFYRKVFCSGDNLRQLVLSLCKSLQIHINR